MLSNDEHVTLTTKPRPLNILQHTRAAIRSSTENGTIPLRFALSTIGYWLPLLGPGAVYVAVARSGGPGGLPVTVLGILTLVWIFGRTAAILSLLTGRWVESTLGFLAIVATGATCQGAILVGSLAFGGDFDADGITRAIEESAVLGGLGYTPPGLVAGIVHEPGPSATNLASLGGLMAILGALTVLEKRLLLHSCLERPGGDRRVASGMLPLTRILRRSRRLTPAATLTALETECLLRLKPAKLSLAFAVGFVLVWVPTAAGLAVSMVGILGVVFHALRVEKQPPTCYEWKESLGLPLSVPRIFHATGRASSVTSVLVFAFALSLTPLDWFGWRFFLVASCLSLAGLLVADAAYGLLQVRWPQRSAGPGDDPSGAKSVLSVLISQVTLVPFGLCFLLYILRERQRLGAFAAGVIAAAVLLVAVGAAYASRRRQARVLDARGPELLLGDPPAARGGGAGRTENSRAAGRQGATGAPIGP